MDKVGVGIVTCNRPNFFIKCFNSIPKDLTIVIVNDGKDFSDWKKLITGPNIHYIHNKTNMGVGKSKNKLFKELLKHKCKHIFIIEDDIVVKDPKVFEQYIKASQVSGIQHFNFGYHGPANRGGISGGSPAPRFIVDYGNIKIAINAHSVGAFCYYTKEVLEKVGLLDEDYTNAFEHVDHDYRIYKAGYGTPYWNFPDLANSCDYLEEIECSERSSSIRPRNDWRENIMKGAALFLKKHSYNPAWQNAVPDSSKEDVIKLLKKLKTRK
ncbi:MAG: glycosyltransferase family 2 protein [Proteobacteria bacterium]|nr:glycosyltransferase family 2 protein [Pseudomonadota bacterium]NBP14785.1 glycosyltransferase family 2 protein [bacterium]